MGDRRRAKGAGLLPLAVALTFAGCTLGPMTVRETHYLAVSNGRDTNYYRLRVAADTRLGVAGYRSGWFPARSVDRLFGEVSSESAPAELQAKTELEMQVIDKIKETQRNWLEAAKNPDTDPRVLEKLNEARRRILAYPAFRAEPFPGTVEIEYNPGRDLATFHVDDKLLFVLSSNPDDVIQQIAAFAEDDKTVLSINRLAGAVVQRSTNEVASREATQEVDKANDARVKQVIQQALQGTTVGTGKATAVSQVDALLSVLDAVNP
jgi:hypothetical protein